MSKLIQKQKFGALARAEKLNEVIDIANPIRNMRVEFLDDLEISQVIWADNNVVIQLPRDRAGSNPSGGGGGGGVPEGFEEETLDIVDAENEPATRVFLTRVPDP